MTIVFRRAQFAIPLADDARDAAQRATTLAAPKCKTPESREAVFALLLALARQHALNRRRLIAAVNEQLVRAEVLLCERS